MKYKSQLVGAIAMCCASAILIAVSSVSTKVTNSLSKVEINGKEYSVPMKVSELTNAGYSIMACDSPDLYKGVANVAYFIDGEGKVITTDVRTQQKSTEIQNGEIVDILVDKGNTKETDVSIKGISFDSTEEEVKRVFGEPIFSFDGDVIYATYLNDSGNDMLSAVLSEGTVVRLEVCNTEGYIPLEE